MRVSSIIGRIIEEFKGFSFVDVSVLLVQHFTYLVSNLRDHIQ